MDNYQGESHANYKNAVLHNSCNYDNSYATGKVLSVTS